jgi:hypothetical protein
MGKGVNGDVLGSMGCFGLLPPSRMRRASVCVVPWRGRYAARADVPWAGRPGGALASHAYSTQPLAALADAVEGACVVGDASGLGDTQALLRLAAIHDLLHGVDPRQVYECLMHAGIDPRGLLTAAKYFACMKASPASGRPAVVTPPLPGLAARMGIRGDVGQFGDLLNLGMGALKGGLGAFGGGGGAAPAPAPAPSAAAVPSGGGAFFPASGGGGGREGHYGPFIVRF